MTINLTQRQRSLLADICHGEIVVKRSNSDAISLVAIEFARWATGSVWSGTLEPTDAGREWHAKHN